MATRDTKVTIGTISKVLLWFVYVWVILNLVLLLLAFVLRLFGASTDAEFTQWVYRSVSRSMAPFRGIAGAHPAQRSVRARHLVAVRDDRVRHRGTVPAGRDRLDHGLRPAAPVPGRAGALGRPAGDDVDGRAGRGARAAAEPAWDRRAGEPASARVTEPAPSTIVTDRLTLTPLVVDDANAMVDVLSDARMYEFTGGRPPDLAALRARYEQMAVGRSPSGDELWFNWIVRLGSEHTPVGAMQATVVADGSSADVRVGDRRCVAGAWHRVGGGSGRRRVVGRPGCRRGVRHDPPGSRRVRCRGGAGRAGSDGGARRR